MAASPQRNQDYETADDSSPFSLLKDGNRIDHGYILKTRSLDETSTPMKHVIDGTGEHSHFEEQSVATALHTSFDFAVFREEKYTSASLFQYDDRPGSRETIEMDTCLASGKKHLRQKIDNGFSEAYPPSTVRKHARRTGVELNSKTPARPRLRHPVSSKKTPCSSTPSSAMKRRKAPLPQRLSPMRRVALITSPPTHLKPRNSTPPTESTCFTHSLTGTPFVQSPQALTPTRLGASCGQPFNPRTKLNQSGNGTVNTVLENTQESDSVDTSSPTTRFRFTAFPASLPRVNNPRTHSFPDSVRKRMSFADTSTLSELNQSRDDDGTHNTSISSLSAEGHHQHLPLAPGTHPPAILELGGGGGRVPDTCERSCHGQLFSDEEFGYSDDDSADSPMRGAVSRTRLNFNMVLSPSNKETTFKSTVGESLMPLDLNMELSRPYDQNRINSFPSSLSSNTHMHELNGTLTPARSAQRERPLTPREVQLHFPPETECSPIPGPRDDAVECAEGRAETASEASSALVGNRLLPRPSQGGFIEGMPKKVAASREDSSTASESTGAKARRLRPMPDMSAFETTGGSSRGERSDDSATLDSKGMLPPQRLLCPPTPVRTPAWASEGGQHGFLGPRQNSLITTKVLLSCPSQVVEGRCSMESSVLDEDSWGSGKPGGAVASLLVDACQNDAAGTSKINEGSSDAQYDGFNPEHHDTSVSHETKTPLMRIRAPPRLTRRIPSSQEVGSVISFSNDFEVLGVLGSGAFADVYKVRSTHDDRLYAVKRNRRQFRGKRDREMALSEVHSMQRLQKVCGEAGGHTPASAERNSYCLYLLFFYRAWQEDGYFFCQTELCCRDTCRELLDSTRFLWSSARTKYPSLRQNLLPTEVVRPGKELEVTEKLIPDLTIWKICHDICAGLSHIHSHKLVHQDIKPSNIFFVANSRFGAMCKIGDFGMAGEHGSTGDGQEGDAKYMPPELLLSGARHPASDIFSLGLTLYELATDKLGELPSEGPGWHELRSSHAPDLPKCREKELLDIIQRMTNPDRERRPSADALLEHNKVHAAGHGYDALLADYIHDIEEFDRKEDERLAMNHHDDQTPINGSNRSIPVRSPSLSMLLPTAPSLLSPLAHQLR